MLNVANKLVYSPHDYPNSVYAAAVVQRPELPGEPAGQVRPDVGLHLPAGHRAGLPRRVRHQARRPQGRAVAARRSPPIWRATSTTTARRTSPAGKHGLSWTFWSWNPELRRHRRHPGRRLEHGEPEQDGLPDADRVRPRQRARVGDRQPPPTSCSRSPRRRPRPSPSTSTPWPATRPAQRLHRQQRLGHLRRRASRARRSPSRSRADTLNEPQRAFHRRADQRPRRHHHARHRHRHHRRRRSGRRVTPPVTPPVTSTRHATHDATSRIRRPQRPVRGHRYLERRLQCQRHRPQ